MAHVGLLYREKIVEEIKNKFSEGESCIIFSFSKLPAFSFNILRNELKKNNISVLVSKNTLFKRAFSDLNIDDLLTASSAAAFVNADNVAQACKILSNFKKENEAFEISLQGGYLQGKKIATQDIEALAKLPPREVLLSGALSALASPLTGFMGVLNQITTKFVWLVSEINDKKEKQQ